MSKLQKHTSEILELSAAITDDNKVVEQLAADFSDCAECGDPISIDDLNKMIAFCESIRTLTIVLIKNVDAIRP